MHNATFNVSQYNHYGQACGPTIYLPIISSISVTLSGNVHIIEMRRSTPIDCRPTHLTLTTLKYFCINHGDQKYFLN